MSKETKGYHIVVELKTGSMKGYKIPKSFNNETHFKEWWITVGKKLAAEQEIIRMGLTLEEARKICKK